MPTLVQTSGNTSQITTGTKVENLSVPVGIAAPFSTDSNVRALLRPGDVLLLPANLNQANNTVASGNLSRLDIKRSGLEKATIFPSIDCLSGFVSLLPPDVT